VSTTYLTRSLRSLPISPREDAGGEGM